MIGMNGPLWTRKPRKVDPLVLPLNPSHITPCTLLKKERGWKPRDKKMIPHHRFRTFTQQKSIQSNNSNNNGI